MAKISDLMPDKNNANKGTERGRGMLERSLRKYGAGRSVLLDGQNRIIAGNKTVEVAADIGLKNVEIIETDGTKLVAVKRTDLDLERDNEARELAYADNRTTDVGLEWDAEQLLADMDQGIDLAKFWGEQEIEDLIAPARANPMEDPGVDLDQAEELLKKWKVERGQVWQVGNHRVMCGNSTDGEDVERLMMGERVNVIITDPPYGINREGIANDDPEGLAELYKRVVVNLPMDDGLVIAFQSPRLFWVLLDVLRSEGFCVERMLWMYKCNDEPFPWRGWLLKSEAILLMARGNVEWNDVKPYVHDVYGLTTMGIELGEIPGHHVSVKPLSVVNDLIKRTSAGRDKIFDPFLGSGTTLVAAEQLGRIGYGLEIEPRYVALTLERLECVGLVPKPVA